MKKITMPELIACGADSLEENEFWCIDHPDGPLGQTASKDFTEPVRIICGALNADWDDLTDQGFRLSKLTRAMTAPVSPKDKTP